MVISNDCIRRWTNSNYLTIVNKWYISGLYKNILWREIGESSWKYLRELCSLGLNIKTNTVRQLPPSLPKTGLFFLYLYLLLPLSSDKLSPEIHCKKLVRNVYKAFFHTWPKYYKMLILSRIHKSELHKILHLHWKIYDMYIFGV